MKCNDCAYYEICKTLNNTGIFAKFPNVDFCPLFEPNSEEFDIQSNVRVCDIIHLFLIGGDDKIYINLATPNKKGYCDDYILKCERIISESWGSLL